MDGVRPQLFIVHRSYEYIPLWNVFFFCRRELLSEAVETELIQDGQNFLVFSLGDPSVEIIGFVHSAAGEILAHQADRRTLAEALFDQMQRFDAVFRMVGQYQDV